MSNTQYRRRHCGYLLVEMIVIIGIMSIAIFVEVKLYRAGMRVIQTEPEAQRNLLSSNQLHAWLRQDVWNAQAMSVDPDGTLSLRGEENHVITWAFKAGQTIRSDSANPGEAGSQRIPTSAKWSARVEGASVIVRVEKEGNLVSEQRYVSQLLFAGGDQ